MLQGIESHLAVLESQISELRHPARTEPATYPESR
jgi:hypothetical protein